MPDNSHNLLDWIWTLLAVPIGWVITRQEKHKEQVHKNAITIATMTNKVDNIETKLNEVHTDVKALLRK